MVLSVFIFVSVWVLSFFVFPIKLSPISMTAKTLLGFLWKIWIKCYYRRAEIQPSRLCEWEAGSEPHLALSQGLTKCWGPDDVAVACLYLALRKRSRKKGGRLEVVFEEVFFFFFNATHYSTHTHSHTSPHLRLHIPHSESSLSLWDCQKKKLRSTNYVSIHFWLSKTVQQQSSWNRRLFVRRQCYHF